MHLMKNTCSSKDIKNKVKRQGTDFEKIFAMHMTKDKYPEFTERVYKSNWRIKDKQPNEKKNGQNIWKCHLQKIKDKWPISTWEHAWSDMLSEKDKLKQ